MPKDNTVFVGLDVHKDSIAVAFVPAALEAAVVDCGTSGTQQYAIFRLIKKLSARGAQLVFAHEAGPCGSCKIRRSPRPTEQIDYHAVV